MGVVHQPIEDAVGQGRVADLLVPLGHGQLTGEDRRAHLTAILTDFQEVAALGVGQGRHRPIVHRQHVHSREASEEELKRLCERRLEGFDLLILYVDGVIFGEHHVRAAVGVDHEGKKQVLGIAEGAGENQTVAKGLLEDAVRRGLATDRKHLFVMDGSKALRAAIDAVFGAENPVQRCRHHKIENVMGYLPDDLKGQVKAVMRSAFRLPAREGMGRLEKQAEWLEREYPSAAASLREGLAEMFTVSRLSLSPSLARCLVSTNVIESPHSGVRLRTRKICRWRDGKMVLRLAAAALLMTEKNFRRMMGYRDLWMLEAALGRKTAATQEKVA